jgi:hypothetical protein
LFLLKNTSPYDFPSIVVGEQPTVDPWW